MPDGVDIGVKVTGAESAQQSLFKTEQAVTQVGGAAGAATPPVSGLSGAVNEAGEAHVHFNRKAEQAVKMVLGTFSPALAEAAHVTFTLSEGITKMSTQLIAFAGVGAAIGVIVAIFDALAESARKAREEIERVEDAKRKLEGEGGANQQKLGQRLTDIGLGDQGRFAERQQERLAQAGIGGKEGEFAAVAAGVLRGRTGVAASDDDLRALAAAFLTRGGKVQFKGDQSDVALVQQLIGEGGTAEAQQFLAGRIQDVGAFVRADEAGVLPSDARTTAAGAVARRRGLTRKQENALRNLLAPEGAEVSGEGGPGARAALMAELRASGLTMEDIRAAREFMAPLGGPGAAINIHIENVGTKYEHQFGATTPPPAFEPSAAAVAGGNGLP